MDHTRRALCWQRLGHQVACATSSVPYLAPIPRAFIKAACRWHTATSMSASNRLGLEMGGQKQGSTELVPTSLPVDVGTTGHRAMTADVPASPSQPHLSLRAPAL